MATGRSTTRKLEVVTEDIVTQLQCAYPSGEWPCESCTSCAARAEIERLREREQDLRMHAEQDACEIERLRAAGDALAATWPDEDRCGCNNKDCRAVVAAYDAWQAARRG